jgi:hypothetical protein
MKKILYPFVDNANFGMAVVLSLGFFVVKATHLSIFLGQRSKKTITYQVMVLPFALHE